MSQPRPIWAFLAWRWLTPRGAECPQWVWGHWHKGEVWPWTDLLVHRPAVDETAVKGEQGCDLQRRIPCPLLPLNVAAIAAQGGGRGWWQVLVFPRIKVTRTEWGPPRWIWSQMTLSLQGSKAPLLSLHNHWGHKESISMSMSFHITNKIKVAGLSAPSFGGNQCHVKEVCFSNNVGFPHSHTEKKAWVEKRLKLTPNRRKTENFSVH